MQTGTNIAAAPASRWRPRFTSPLARLLLLGALILILNVPLAMIHGVVSERADRRSEAVADILSAWGGQQALIGPILRVPFTVHNWTADEHGRKVDKPFANVAYFLPRTLRVDAKLETSLRHRGIFEVPVYVAHVDLKGRFEQPDFSAWNVRPEDIDWAHAELAMGLTEPRTLQADTQLEWAGQALPFRPSPGLSTAWLKRGIHVSLGAVIARPFAGDGADFRIHLSCNGADALSFAPTAEQTEVALAANWPHPSFQGDWLPAQHQIRGDGFDAQWSVSYLGRDYPQRWADSASPVAALDKSLFGVSLAGPGDPYAMADRVLKYAVLSLLFTFAVIWLTEMLSGQFVHPIQYGFVGAALCLFGLLQLSFAEHFGFTPAFVVAAAAVVAMVTLYCRSLLRRTWQALAVGGVLGGLYAYLYAILRAEDHALLGGSLALFAGLGLAMYLTRKVDWAALGGSTQTPAK